jgi:cytochrome c2
VYTAAQAQRGQAIFKDRCVSCHGATLGGDLAPPLAGQDFVGDWNFLPLSGLVDKIHKTMPQNDPGKLTREQATELVAYILQVGKFPAGRTELSSEEASLKMIVWPVDNSEPKQITLNAAQALSSRPMGNLAQLMRGILFPSSNIIFNVQAQDPGAPKAAFEQGKANFSWTDWGSGIYSGWEIVDYAAIALAEAAPRILAPRRCENGKPAPVARADWVQFTAELTDAARAAYRASQSRNQEAMIEVSNQVADACLHCHEVYRDKPGGSLTDPSNKAARCVP